MQHARGIRRTTAVEKVLSLDTFRYTFVRENVTSLSDGFLLVFFIKNFMTITHVICLLTFCEIQYA